MGIVLWEVAVRVDADVFKGKVMCVEWFDVEHSVRRLAEIGRLPDVRKFEELEKWYMDFRDVFGRYCFVLPSFARLVAVVLGGVLCGSSVVVLGLGRRVLESRVSLCSDVPSLGEEFELIENEDGEPCVKINGEVYCLHDVWWCWDTEVQKLLLARLMSLQLKHSY